MAHRLDISILALSTLFFSPLYLQAAGIEQPATADNDTILSYLYDKMNPPMSWNKVAEADKKLISQMAFSSEHQNRIGYIKRVLISYLVAQLKGKTFDSSSVEKCQNLLLVIHELDAVTYEELKSIVES